MILATLARPKSKSVLRHNLPAALTTPDAPDDCTISRVVVSLAHGLGLTVVADGVETERQRASLMQIGGAGNGQATSPIRMHQQHAGEPSQRVGIENR